MEQAYTLHGDVLVEHGVSKNDGLDAVRNELTSYEKPEEQMIVWCSESPVQFIQSSKVRELSKNEAELVDQMVHWLILECS